jgi:hypothetical protein
LTNIIIIIATIITINITITIIIIIITIQHQTLTHWPLPAAASAAALETTRLPHKSHHITRIPLKTNKSLISQPITHTLFTTPHKPFDAVAVSLSISATLLSSACAHVT